MRLIFLLLATALTGVTATPLAAAEVICVGSSSGFAGGYLGVRETCSKAMPVEAGGHVQGTPGDRVVDPWEAICALVESQGRDCIRVVDGRPADPAEPAAASDPITICPLYTSPSPRD